MPGSKKGDKKGLLFTTASMLAHYQQGGRCLFWVVGKAGAPREKSPQACTEHVKPWTLHKHKRRDIGLPDRMEVPNRQAAQRGWINWNYPVGYTVSLLVTLIYDGLPKPRLFQKGQEFPSPTFSEAPGTSNRN